jgi:trehalose synthase
VNSIEEAAERSLELLEDPKKADEMGAAGKEWVRENFLSTRELRDWLGLFGELKS